MLSLSKKPAEEDGRASPRYMREMAQHMIITHTRLSLLETIGQGRIICIIYNYWCGIRNI